MAHRHNFATLFERVSALCLLTLCAALPACAGKPPCQRDLIFTLQGTVLDCATQAPAGQAAPAGAHAPLTTQPILTGEQFSHSTDAAHRPVRPRSYQQQKRDTTIMTKTKAATLLQASAKALKAGAKVAACERRLEKLRKDCARAEAEYMGLVAETFATRSPGSGQSVTGEEGQPAA